MRHLEYPSLLLFLNVRIYLHEYTPLAEEIARLEAVTPDDVRDVLAAYPFQPRGILRLTPRA